MPNDATVLLDGTPYDLSGLEHRAWSLLEEATADPKNPLHSGTLASNGEGGYPASRTMVARHADAGARQLCTHTDARTAKVAGLRRDGRASWTFWDADGCVQLQLAGTVDVLTGDASPLVRAQWETLAVPERRSYCATDASSVQTDGPLAAKDGSPDPETFDRAASEKGFDNFAVLSLQVEIVEVLFLGKPDHFRARVRYVDGAAPERTWRTP